MEKEQILDLKINGNLKAEYLSLYNKIANDIRPNYTSLVEDISEGYHYNLDWWVSTPVSRNTYSSPLFHYCCSLVLLQELLKNNEPISIIITDSKALKSILKSYFRQQNYPIRVHLSLTLKHRIKKQLAPIYNILKTPVLHILQHLSAKLTHHLSKALPQKPLVLIDTFVVGSNLNDRYYPGLWDSLTVQEKDCVRFVPTLLHPPRKCIQLYKSLRTSNFNFLLKEDYLRVSDYWHAWNYWIRVFKIRVRKTDFSGFNMSPLVQEELRSLNGYYNAFLAILNFRFVKRLSESEVKLKLIINWFENQTLDKGSNAGFRKYFPDVKIKGYQGLIITHHHLCMYPTSFEQQLGLIPHEVDVIGKGLAFRVKEFCQNDKNVSVSLAPAFRFQSVWNPRKYYPTKGEYTVFVALSIVLEEGNHILRLISFYLQKGIIDQTHFWIKPHPTNQPDQIKKLFTEKWPKEFKFVNDDFNDCIEQSNLLITSGSGSSGMNALAKGVPVIIVGNQTGLLHNPIPKAITEDIWCMCCTEDEVSQAIIFYKNSSSKKIKEYESIGKRIRDMYFEPVTKEGVRNFLMLSEG